MSVRTTGNSVWLVVGVALTMAGCQQSPTGPDEAPSALAGNNAASGTYYVAAGETGADNERCDGRSPSFVAAGRCPFRDFSSNRTQALLTGARAVRVELRAGTYAMPGGLTVEGTGTSESQRVVLTNYGGEAVVLDGGSVAREVLRVSGRYVTVQGLTIQNSAAYNLEVRGGQQVLLADNRF